MLENNDIYNGIIDNKFLDNVDILFENFYQQVYQLNKIVKNNAMERFKKEYKYIKEKQRDNIIQIFSTTDLKCKNKFILGEPAKHGLVNTFYFNGSANYSTFIRIDDMIKLYQINCNINNSYGYFCISSLVDRLSENLKINILRDKKYDYDHYIKNISYKIQDIDLYKPKRQQTMRILFGQNGGFINNDIKIFNEIDKLIYFCCIENNFFHSYCYDKSNKTFINGNEFILYFFHASWRDRELINFQISKDSNKYYFFCQNHFYISSLWDFVFETDKTVHIEFDSVGDFTVINDEYIIFLTENFSLYIMSTKFDNGLYSLEDCSYLVDIPHDDICSCKDMFCLKKVIAHPLCHDHFLVYGTKWCLLFKLYPKNNPPLLENEEFAIEIDDSLYDSNVDDEESEDEGGNMFSPKTILCEVVPTETINCNLSDAPFELMAIDIHVSSFKNFIGASFLPYKNECRYVVLVDTCRFYTFNVDTFKFGPCSDSFLRKKDEFDEFIKCDQAVPFVIMESKEKFYYYIWKGRRNLHCKYAVSGFKYNGIASFISEPRENDEYDFYGIGYFTPPTTQKRGLCEIFHRYRQKTTIFFKSTEINEIVDMKIRYIDSKSYLIIQLDSKNIFIAPLMRNLIIN